MPIVLVAPAVAATSAPHHRPVVRLGFDATDSVCVWQTRTIRISWTETPFSRNVVAGADGRCQTTPRYIVETAAAVRAARNQTRRLGLAVVPGTLDVRVLDVRGVTGGYGATTTAPDGTSRVAIDTYLFASGLRSVALDQSILASENVTMRRPTGPPSARSGDAAGPGNAVRQAG